MAKIGEAMERHVEAGVPGMAWAVAHGGDVEVGAAGNARRDTIFRIASMTKPITAVAALVLVERCELRLDDAVDDLLPELADRRVMRDPDGSIHDTVPAIRPITLRDLLTFRIGVGMDFTRFGRQPLLDALNELGCGVGAPAPATQPGDDEWMQRLGSLPLEFQPGERWLYHLGSDVLGVLLSRAAGRPLGDVLRALVLEPLGMRDTAFSVPADKLDRFTDCVTGAEVYDRVDGQWCRPPTFASGGGGLVSTVDDYLAFATMLRDGGHPILSRATVELMTTDQLTAEQRTTSGPAFDGSEGWGFGVSVKVRRTDHENVGSYGWSGGLGTSWGNDPAADLVTVLLTNQMFTSATLPAVHRDLLTCAYT